MSKFPEGFLWGAATSAFQTEGQIVNDMLLWERAGRFKQNGKNPQYGVAANHWEMWPQDYRIIKEHNLNAYRFSVEWARIEPEKGRIDQEALDQYERMVDCLLDLKITPMLTLHHFSHPAWFHEVSPWHEKQSVDRFLFFAEKVIKRMGSKINLYITFNEPLVWALAAYGDGKFPPGFKDLNIMMTVIYNMLYAHREAYKIIKNENPDSQIGIAKHLIQFQAATWWNPASQLLKSFINHFFTEMLFKAFKTNKLEINLPFILSYSKKIKLNDAIDFWGVNYYYRMFIRWKKDKQLPFELFFEDRSGNGMTDMGWEIYPQGLYNMIKKTAAFGKDVYVTENGIATTDDTRRITYLKQHLAMVKKALTAGLPLKGYFYWSLLDNYEWLEGTRAKFGLVDVDFENAFIRTPKESARYFQKHISPT